MSSQNKRKSFKLIKYSLTEKPLGSVFLNFTTHQSKHRCRQALLLRTQEQPYATVSWPWTKEPLSRKEGAGAQP